MNAPAAVDLLVLGGGAGGCAAALRAARRGARVVLVSDGPLGGACLHAGCIPTKTLLASTALARAAARADDFGLDMTVAPPALPRLQERQRKIVAASAAGLEFLLQKAGVGVVRGRGRLRGGKKLAVGEQTFAAEKIILATGSRPLPLTGFPCDGKTIFDSDQILHLDRLPARVAIVGGGYIGCEFASLFAALGCVVTIYEMTGSLLPGLDPDLGAGLARSFARQNIIVHTNLAPEGAADLTDADAILVAVGRAPNVDRFDREAEDLALDESGRFLRVDQRLRTSAEGIYAVGDITGAPMLAHVALAQARVAVDNAMGGEATIQYDSVPACIFTHPEIATVGLTEPQAAARGNIRVGKFPFAALGKAAAVAATEGFVKLIAEAGSGKILGGHILGGAASEQIAALALAVEHGLTAKQLAESVVAHPTFNEAIVEAAEALVHGRPLHLARPML